MFFSTQICAAETNQVQTYSDTNTGDRITFLHLYHFAITTRLKASHRLRLLQHTVLVGPPPLSSHLNIKLVSLLN